MEALIFINQYIKYVYWFLIAGLLGALIYLFVNLKPVFKQLGVLGNGVGEITGKLDRLKEGAAKVSATVKRTVPLLAGFFGINALLKILVHILRKGDDDKRHIRENIRREIDNYGRKQSRRKMIQDVSKTARTVSTLLK